MENSWFIDYQDWLELGSCREVYNDVKRGVKAGESYIVRDIKGVFTGVVTMDSHGELRVNFQKI